MNDLNSDINLKNIKQELVIIEINLTGYLSYFHG